MTPCSNEWKICMQQLDVVLREVKPVPEYVRLKRLRENEKRKAATAARRAARAST